MLTFSYAAMTADNTYVKGEIHTSSLKKATAKLESQGLLLININRDTKLAWEKMLSYSTVNRLDKIHFTRHLYSFMDAGIALNQAIHLAGEQTENHKLKEILDSIYKDINAGKPLSTALLAYKKYFSNYYIQLIKVGEQTGSLDNNLKHLLEQQEREYELLSNIRGAMIYPAVVIFAAVAAVVFLMTFVVPTIAGVLAEYGTELPISTKILIAISNFLLNYGLFMLVSSPLFIYLFYRLLKTKKGTYYSEKILFALPIIKKIVKEYNNARIMRSLSAPIISGMSINQALELAADTTNNGHYRRSLIEAGPFVQKGVPVSEALRRYPELYPPNVLGMIEIGENTGKIDDMLMRLATFYEESVFHRFKNFSSVIEPFLLLSIGIVIGFVAVSILTPIWKFADTI